ncbi:MAG: hypothetical protein IPL61_22130 [Myxococcales bacterium]|nr:hypothetical protein [Myxococcales bacterium]
MTAPAWLDRLCAQVPAMIAGPRAPAPDRPRALAIIGGSGAGKTTLVDGVRAAAIAGVVVPERRVTRPPRRGDHPAEAAHRDAAAFAAEVAAGVLRPSWQRRLGGRVERYGFVAAPGARLLVYSGNAALVDAAAALTPPDALADALVVAVVAPSAVRAARLAARSPDLDPAERAARLAEAAPPAHAIIDNGGDDPAPAIAALLALVRAAVAR